MPFERDPLSVRYDPTAGALIGRAIAARGTWVYTTVARPAAGPRTREWLRAHGIALDAIDEGGLTAYERAYQRSLYWTMAGNPRWSLQRDWGPVTSRGRMLAVRITPPAAARAAVQRMPASEQWWRNPDQQSGGVGSTKRRFA